MKGKKFLKGIVYLLLAISLLSGAVYRFLPDSYASYRTGYSVDTIVGYRTGGIDNASICKSFFPEKVAQTSGELFFFSLLIFSLALVIALVFTLRIAKDWKGSARHNKDACNFAILLLMAFLMLFAGFVRDYEYDYATGCAQLQANGEFL